MTAYTEITDVEIDPEKPITESKLQRLRDNPMAIAEGDPSAPRIHPVFMHLREELPATTMPTTLGSGSAWVSRLINTTVYNNIAAPAARSGATFILGAGTYYIRSRSSMQGSVTHRSRLYNVTAAAAVLYGTSEFVSTNNASSSVIEGRFVLAVTSTLQIEHRSSSNGIPGQPTSIAGINEIYGDHIIEKIA